MNKKEEATAGIFSAVVIFSLVVIVLFLFSPISHYLGKWSDYWDSKDSVVNTTTIENSTIAANYQKYSSAVDACYKVATKFFGTDKVAVYASTTSGTYETYDCYGMKYLKIPLVK